MMVIADVSSYHSIVGDLQYLTMTCHLWMLLTKLSITCQIRVKSTYMIPNLDEVDRGVSTNLQESIPAHWMISSTHLC
jgi:hypothetical protein